MDLRQLRYFVCVAERGSISAAASVLHVAQSAVSRHMRLLEEQLGTSLFERSVGGSSLNESGALLLERARFILSQVESAASDVSKLHEDVQGTVRLAAPSSIGHLLYFRIIDEFLRRFPRVQLELSESPTENVLDRLIAGALDVGIVTEPKAQPYLELSPLMQEGTVVICRSDDALSKRKRVSASALMSLPVIVSGGLRRVFADRFGPLDTAIQLDGVWPAMQLASTGKGYAILPRSAVVAHARQFDLAAIPIHDFCIARSIAVSKGRPASLAMRALMETIRIQAALLEQ